MSDPLVIPYGVPSLRSGQVALHDGTVECPAPFVAIDRRAGKILQLNGNQYAFPEAPDLRAMTDAAVQSDFLRDHLKHYCDLWARPPKLFLDCYFEFAAKRVEQNETHLTKLLDPFGTLFSYRDWALSAPRPLPRAQLAAAEGSYAAVDFAFWLGDRVFAVLLVGSETPTNKKRDRCNALEAAGIEIVELSVNLLAREGSGYLASGVLPKEFDAFWEGDLIPSSPFQGTSLGDIVRE